MTALNPFWLLGVLGLLAIEGSYFPQILRLYYLKRAEEVSLLFPALNLAGRLLAMTYAILTAEHVFSGGLLVGIVLRGTLLAQVVWYRRRCRILAPASPASAVASS